MDIITNNSNYPLSDETSEENFAVNKMKNLIYKPNQKNKNVSKSKSKQTPYRSIQQLSRSQSKDRLSSNDPESLER